MTGFMVGSGSIRSMAVNLMRLLHLPRMVHMSTLKKLGMYEMSECLRPPA